MVSKKRNRNVCGNHPSELNQCQRSPHKIPLTWASSNGDPRNSSFDGLFIFLSLASLFLHFCEKPHFSNRNRWRHRRPQRREQNHHQLREKLFFCLEPKSAKNFGHKFAKKVPTCGSSDPCCEDKSLCSMIATCASIAKIYSVEIYGVHDLNKRSLKEWLCC